VLAFQTIMPGAFVRFRRLLRTLPDWWAAHWPLWK
jgi:hypothetical protein